MSSKPNIVQTPFSSTTKTNDDYGDIAKLRDFDPSSYNRQFDRAETDLKDSYGAYTGIPSAVARKRLYDEGYADLEGGRAQAYEQAKLGQLEGVANLTKGSTQSGYNSQVAPPSGLLNSIIGAGASVAGAALI